MRESITENIYFACQFQINFDQLLSEKKKIFSNICDSDIKKKMKTK